jgi:hypothetical protein
VIDSRLGRLAVSLIAAVAAVSSVWGFHIFLVMIFSIFTDSAWIKAAILERTGSYDDIALVIRGPIGWPLAPLFLASFFTVQLAFNPRVDKNKILAPTVLLAAIGIIHSLGTYYACYGLLEILSGEFTYSGQAVGWDRLLTQGGMFLVKSIAGAGYTAVSIWIVIVCVKLSLERKKNQKQIELRLSLDERKTYDSQSRHHNSTSEEESSEKTDKRGTLPH